MTLINPFVPFTDLEPLEFRREALGEVGGIFFYNVDEEHVARYQRVGGAVYPSAVVSTITQPSVSFLETQHDKIEKKGEETNGDNVSSSSSPTSSSSSSYYINNNNNNNTYVPSLSSTLRKIVSYLPFLSAFTYKTDTASRIAQTPGEFYFRLNPQKSPFSKTFITGKFCAQAMAFHPYFSILAVAEQRSPTEASIIRFYDVANGCFIDELTLTHPTMRGVTVLKWKPFSRNVLAVGVNGGVMMWVVHGLDAALMAVGGHVGAKADGRQSLLAMGGRRRAAGGSGGCFGQAVGSSFIANNNSNNVNGSYSYSYSSNNNSSCNGGGGGGGGNGAAVLLKSSTYSALYSGNAVGIINNNNNRTDNANGKINTAENTMNNTTNTNTNGDAMGVQKRKMNELSLVLGQTAAQKAAASGLGSVDWSVANTSKCGNNNSLLYRADGAADASSSTEAIFAAAAALKVPPAHFITYALPSPTVTAAPTTAPNNNYGNNKSSRSSALSSSSSSSSSSHHNAGGIPVTDITFSDINGALMAISSRGSPELAVHNVSCRPSEALLVRIAAFSEGIASNVSCTAFSMDDSFIIRGFETANRLAVTTLNNNKNKNNNYNKMKTRYFQTPAPILKIVRLEVLGFNVFALMMKSTEAVTIAHISPNELTILANVVTGEHCASPSGTSSSVVGGAVVDITASSYNLYVHVASGHILVMALSGSVCNNNNNSSSSRSGGGNNSKLFSSSNNNKNNNNNFILSDEEAKRADEEAATASASSTATPSTPYQQQLKMGASHSYGNNSSSVSNAAATEIGVYVKGAIPVPKENRHIVSMAAFPSFTRGALLAVSDSESGTIRFVPSYFSRAVDAAAL